MPTYRNSNRSNEIHLISKRVIAPGAEFEARADEVPAVWLELPVERPEVNGVRPMVERVSEAPAE
jgi:hypothetical protein